MGSEYWQNHRSRKIDPEDVGLIRALRGEGLSLRSIADKFELSKSHVCKIVNGKTWKHLDPRNEEAHPYKPAQHTRQR